MNHQRRLAALGVNTLVVSLLLAGCGDFNSDDSTDGSGGATATGGAAPTGGVTATGGVAATGGTTASGGDTGTGGGVSCEAATPCGGDVVGTWTVTSSCLALTGDADMMGFGLGCTTSPITGSPDIGGSWTFNGDGTFVDNTTTSGSVQINLLATCLNVSGTTTTCDRVGSTLGSLGFTSTSCAADAATGGCNCPCTLQQTGGMAAASFSPVASGSYTVADNVITVAGGDTQYAYCVTGTTMTMTPQPAAGMTSKLGTYTGAVVLQKQ